MLSFPLPDVPEFTDKAWDAWLAMARRLISNGMFGNPSEWQGLFIERGLPIPWSGYQGLLSDEECIGTMELFGEKVGPLIQGRRRYGSREEYLVEYDKETNAILERFEIGMRMTGGRIHRIDSPAMAETLEWPLRLATLDRRWGPVESQFSRARTLEITDPPSAVASAAQSVETTLQLIGCQGRSLGDLTKDFERRFQHRSLVKADNLKSLMDLVARTRMTGTAHGQTDLAHAATEVEARLAISMAGTIIRYLFDTFKSDSSKND